MIFCVFINRIAVANLAFPVFEGWRFDEREVILSVELAESDIVVAIGSDPIAESCRVPFAVLGFERENKVLIVVSSFIGIIDNLLLLR